MTLKQLSHKTDTYVDIEGDRESIITLCLLNFHTWPDLESDVSLCGKKWEKEPQNGF